jgi:bacteriorhodopsin
MVIKITTNYLQIIYIFLLYLYINMNKAILSKSYEITFLMLICITIIVYVRSLNKQLNNKQIVSLQLAGLVTSVAAFHYYYMITTKGSPVSYRYFDWFFTTPILLLELCILLDIYDYDFIVKIGVLNTLMLLFGYLGEINVISMVNSTILGFVPFVLMFYMIKQKLKDKNKYSKEQQIMNNRIYYTFAGLWTLYGVNHLVPNLEVKNTIYNVLDLITKGMFGLYIYYVSL